jgi:dihydrofolate reductase
MIPYWLAVAQNPAASAQERAIARAVNRLHPCVLSRKTETLAWEQSELLVVTNDDDLRAAVTKIRQQPGKDLGVPGGIRTAQTFVRLGLIDEYVLTVQPVVLGQGQSIFTSRVPLELLRSKAYRSGVLRVWYRPGQRA